MQELLTSLAGTAYEEWVFPSENGDEPLTKDALYTFWIKVHNATFDQTIERVTRAIKQKRDPTAEPLRSCQLTSQPVMHLDLTWF